MANIGKWNAAVLQTALLTTELNSLGSAAFSAASAAYDNTSPLDVFADFELVLASLTPSAGQYVAVYLEEAVDGTNYEMTPTVALTSQLLCVFPLDTAASAKRLVVRNVVLPPAKFKVTIYNSGTTAFAASGNTLKMLTYDMNLNG